MTAEPTLNTSPIPGSKAYPLNQGFSYTCTHHAIANAVADQLADKHIDIDQKIFAGILISNTGSIGPIWPHFFDNYHIPVLSMNETDKKWISVKINIVREVKEFSNTGKHVLAYHTKEILPDGTWKWGEYHCVFVKQQSENHYVCVNSWGDRDKYPEVELNRPGNRLWIVSAEFQFAQGGWSFIIFHTLSRCSIYLLNSKNFNEKPICLDLFGNSNGIEVLNLFLSKGTFVYLKKCFTYKIRNYRLTIY